MKALILAAGKGKRLGSLTNGAPKSLLPLGGSTLLGRSLEVLERCGIRDLVVVTGYERGQIDAYVREHWPGRFVNVFNPHYETTNVLYSFWLALPHIGDDDVLFVHADTVFSEEVLRRLLAADSGQDLTLAVDGHACAEEEMKVRLEGGQVVEISKEMPSEASEGEFLGVARMSGRSLRILQRRAEELFEAGVFGAFVERAIQEAISAGELSAYACDVTGLPWREVDFEEDYRAAQALFPE